MRLTYPVLASLVAALVVGLVIAFPNLVVGGLNKGPKIDVDKAMMQLDNRSRERVQSTLGGQPASGAEAAQPREQDEAMRMLLESMQREADKKK